MASRPLVVDTGVFGARLATTSELADLYDPILADHRTVVSFQTVAELRYGALLRRWGRRRTSHLDRLLQATEVVWAGAGLVEICARLRVACVTTGHALGQQHHDADRWIAATAIRLDAPLVTHDAIFRGAPGLEVLTRLP